MVIDKNVVDDQGSQKYRLYFDGRHINACKLGVPFPVTKVDIFNSLRAKPPSVDYGCP